MTLHHLPNPVRTPPAPRFRIAQAVLTPDNRVALLVGQVLRPEGLMAFIVDGATPARRRISRMVPYDSLRPAPNGRPQLVHTRCNSRNPLFELQEQPVHEAAPSPKADAAPVTQTPARQRPQEPQDDGAPIPGFLRAEWVRDTMGRRLSPYPPRLAAIALLAFWLWPSRAAMVFEAARTIEAARTGALICGPGGQSVLARIAARAVRP